MLLLCDYTIILIQFAALMWLKTICAAVIRILLRNLRYMKHMDHCCFWEDQQIYMQ